MASWQLQNTDVTNLLIVDFSYVSQQPCLQIGFPGRRSRLVSPRQTKDSMEDNRSLSTMVPDRLAPITFHRINVLESKHSKVR